MSGCEQLRDRLPDVAAGRGGWTELEAAHLAGCAECQAEWQLVLAARSLGHDLSAAADPARIARGALNRLAADRRRGSWRRRGWMVGLAAAAVVVLVLGRGNGSAPIPSVRERGPFELPIAELESLDAGQLQAVLETLDEPVAAHSSPGVPALGDLNAEQLERVLRSLEG